MLIQNPSLLVLSALFCVWYDDTVMQQEYPASYVQGWLSKFEIVLIKVAITYFESVGILDSNINGNL